MAELIFKLFANRDPVLIALTSKPSVLTRKLEMPTVLRASMNAAPELILVVERKFVLNVPNVRLDDATVWPTEISRIYVLAKVT